MAHSQNLGGLVNELTGRSWLTLLGPVLLMLLILIPMIAAVEMYRALGKEGWKRLLLDPRD